MLKFLTALFWEFVQNLPVVAFFVAAVWLWTHRPRWQAVICVVVGAMISALDIRLTEPLKTGYAEPWSVTLVNAVVLCLIEPPFVAYLGAGVKWSSWKTDLLLGGLAGAGLAIAQGMASQGSPVIGIIVHSISLAVASALILIAIRMVKDKPWPSAMRGAILIAVVMTLLIGLIDYSYLLFT